MADTLPLMPITSEWANVYEFYPSLSVGTALALNVYNTRTHIDLAISATEPTDDSAVFPIFYGNPTTTLSQGESGLWARSSSPSRLSVQDNS